MLETFIQNKLPVSFIQSRNCNFLQVFFFQNELFVYNVGLTKYLAQI